MTFAGIYFKLVDLMSMFSLKSGESQSMGRQILRRPRMLMMAHMNRLQHKLGRSIAANGKKSNVGKKSSNGSGASSSRVAQEDHTKPDGKQQEYLNTRESFGRKAGQAASKAMDTKDHIKGTAEHSKEQIKNLLDNPLLNKERKIVKKDRASTRTERKPPSDRQSNRTSNIEKQPYNYGGGFIDYVAGQDS